MNSDRELLITLLGTTVIFFLLVGFIIAFVFYFRQKQIQNKLEKESMKDTFEKELLLAQIEVQEQTLHHISQELHDNIGQILSLVKINLNSISGQEDHPAIQKIHSTKMLVGKALNDLRSLSKTLDANYVLRSKLSEAIIFELGYIEQAIGCKTQLLVEGAERMLSPQQQIVVFRITQEVLNNAIKHARAETISVTLTFTKTHFQLMIKDDGQGFETGRTVQNNVFEQGAGLVNMEKRAALIGAKFELESTLGLGTTVILRV